MMIKMEYLPFIVNRVIEHRDFFPRHFSFKIIYTNEKDYFFPYKKGETYRTDFFLYQQRQLFFDKHYLPRVVFYVLQTDMHPESIILFYYKREVSQLRDKQLEKLFNDDKPITK